MSTLTLCNNCLREGAKGVDVGPEKGSQRDPYRDKLMLCDECSNALLSGDLKVFSNRRVMVRSRVHRAQAAEAEVERLREALRRATHLAENLHGMIDKETWRDQGAEWMGQYEGDHWAEQTYTEIKSLASLSAARDDAAAYASFLAADHAASVAHDFIWGKNGVTQKQASDAIWTIHNALRPLIVFEGDDVSGDLEGKLRNEDDTALRNYLAKPKGIDE